MASFIVEGNHRLHGEITPQGAKNEALQVICATLLTTEEVIIENVPDILDVNNLINLLADMGVHITKKMRLLIVSKPNTSTTMSLRAKPLWTSATNCEAL